LGSRGRWCRILRSASPPPTRSPSTGLATHCQWVLGVGRFVFRMVHSALETWHCVAKLLTLRRPALLFAEFPTGRWPGLRYAETPATCRFGKVKSDAPRSHYRAEVRPRAVSF